MLQSLNFGRFYRYLLGRNLSATIFFENILFSCHIQASLWIYTIDNKIYFPLKLKP